MDEWGVSRTTEIEIDFTVFELWLQGKQSKEILQELSIYAASTNYKEAKTYSDDVVLSHVLDQLSLYHFLKNYLEHPWNFVVLRYQLDMQPRNKLISIYYSFNENFARELLNHRISSKLRKDVDEIATKLRLPLISCLRCFDNIRIVLNKFDDYDRYSMIEYIKQSFHVAEDLAKSYATIAFLQQFKFDVSRKRMQFLTFSDLTFISVTLMRHWCVWGSVEEGNIGSGGSCASLEMLDRDFFSRIHECKNLDSECVSSLNDLVSKSQLDGGGSSGDFKETGRQVLKEILTLSGHLKDIKEMIYLFYKISEAASSLSLKQFSSIFNCLSEFDWSEKDVNRIYKKDWQRFISCTRKCCERIHEAARLNKT